MLRIKARQEKKNCRGKLMLYMESYMGYASLNVFSGNVQDFTFCMKLPTWVECLVNIATIRNQSTGDSFKLCN